MEPNLLTVFQSYQNGGCVIMNGCAQLVPRNERV